MEISIRSFFRRINERWLYQVLLRIVGRPNFIGYISKQTSYDAFNYYNKNFNSQQ